jgi:hypothetical protein
MRILSLAGTALLALLAGGLLALVAVVPLAHSQPVPLPPPSSGFTTFDVQTPRGNYYGTSMPIGDDFSTSTVTDPAGRVHACTTSMIGSYASSSCN